MWSRLICDARLAKKVEIAVAADGPDRTIVDEEASYCRAGWKTMEMEEKPSSVAAAVQVEVAKAMETLRMD